MSTKTCTKCKKKKPTTEFHTRKSSKDGLTCRCKSCRSKYSAKRYKKTREENLAQSRKWYKENRFKAAIRDSKKRATRRGHMACTANEEEIRKALSGNCNICGVHETNLSKRLSMDHCHKTGKFRGWLCDRCNLLLGIALDSDKRLIAAILYLKGTR